MSSADLYPSQDSLPVHWEMRIDPRTGLPYYLNHQEQFTTWDDPRLVDSPRSMLNNMGSMLRPSSTLDRVRQKSAEPRASSNTFLSTPSHDYYAQSLPRRRPTSSHQSHSMMRRPFGDEWFGRFRDMDDDFFGSGWPFKSHTIQRQHPARAQSVQPESMRTRTMPQQRAEDDSCQRAANSADNRYQGEHYITPTQYKKRNRQLHPFNNNSTDQGMATGFPVQSHEDAKPTDVSTLVT